MQTTTINIISDLVGDGMVTEVTLKTENVQTNKKKRYTEKMKINVDCLERNKKNRKRNQSRRTQKK